MIRVDDKILNIPNLECFNMLTISSIKIVEKTCLVFLFLIPTLAFAQKDTLPPDLSPIQNAIEDFVENNDQAEFDFNTIFENLESLKRRPMNLNRVGEIDLLEFGLLTDAQVNDFLNYRDEMGKLISIYELQSIPSFQVSDIRRILPFVTLGDKEGQFNASIGEMVTKGQNDLFLRWSRFLEKQRGFLTDDFLGDPNKFYLRFRHNYYQKFSFGITAEKDIGEEFFSGSNRSGFDFYSAHIFLRDYNKRIKALALGDFTVNFGQGLILYTGFSTAKSSFVTNIKANSRTLSQYSSVNEINFMRGIGATIGLTDKLELTVFGSRKKRDGTATLDAALENLEATSFIATGLRRTLNEIAKERSIEQNTVGSRLAYRDRKFNIAFNALYNNLGIPLNRTPRIDNQFSFSGDQLLNFSADYSFFVRNLNFFGETAFSDNGAIATLNGLLVSLNPKVDLAVLQRHFPRNFHVLDSRPFSDRRITENESGVYVGLSIRPAKGWTLSGFYDVWKHPWLRFGVDAPSTGNEWRGRLTYDVRRKWSVYLEVRRKTRERNLSENETRTDILIPTYKMQTRLNFSTKITSWLEWRSRFDYIRAKVTDGSTETGVMFYQDLIFRQLGNPFSFTTRFAVFDTDSFNSASYNYENDVIYFFSIPAYFNRGSRFYFNLRYKGIRKMTIEGRIAQTFFSDQDTVGSGLDEIQGNRRTEVRFQIRYTFGK